MYVNGVRIIGTDPRKINFGFY